jgi:BirA family transcriptional regulator, biotin operon repressor / biotin---[acetyl-CoA-carboxylase] ligase
LYKILANTLFFGKNVVFVPQCHSTNTLLIELAQKTNQPEGTLVITHTQTQGRGQRGNSWEAEPGKNLTFSFLLRPHFLSANEQFYLNMAVSLGLHDFLFEKISSPVKIKWPNDLMVLEKKIAGILIENSLATQAIQQSVVGIGLNVNQRTFSIDTATSMWLETNSEYAIAHELNLLLEKLEIRYLQLRSKKNDLLRADYLKNLFRMEEEHEFVSAGQHFLGTIEGIDIAGKLKINSKGKDLYFGLKEISFAR